MRGVPKLTALLRGSRTLREMYVWSLVPMLTKRTKRTITSLPAPSVCHSVTSICLLIALHWSAAPAVKIERLLAQRVCPIKVSVSLGVWHWGRNLPPLLQFLHGTFKAVPGSLSSTPFLVVPRQSWLPPATSPPLPPTRRVSKRPWWNPTHFLQTSLWRQLFL